MWWAREPRKVMRDFLARAGAVYVTADSLTMVAEAIYAGRPVHVVRPPQGVPEAQDAQALLALVAENGAGRNRLQNYIVNLASEREHELVVMDQEAQRCRGMISRMPAPKPQPKKPLPKKTESK